MDKEYTCEMMGEDLNNGYEIVTHKNYYQIIQKTHNQEYQC